MIEAYLTQLERLAAGLDVDLGEACEAEGVVRTTLSRWRAGSNHPREETAKRVADRIRQIAESRSQANQDGGRAA